MFDNLIRELNRLSETTEISIPLEYDAEGFIDKECPQANCIFQFKVHSEDWKSIVRDEEVFCPSCGHSAPAKSWYTTAQVAAAKNYAVDQIGNALNAAMRADANASKRRQQSNAFFSITLDVKGGRDIALLPIAAAEPMRLRTTCEHCNCRYSYIGAAYFCPSCGNNSASHTFAQTLKAIRASVSVTDVLRETLNRDDAEVITRSLLEKALLDGVTSFQRLSEQLYEKRTGAPARRNAFQNLEAGSELWVREIGVKYEDILSSESSKKLQSYFQQRHLLAHKQGIVDFDYLERSGDSAYEVGHRLIVHGNAVLEFAELVERLGNELISRAGKP